MSAGRALDVVATSVAVVVLVVESVAAFILTGFFVMATDACGPGDCSTDRIALGSGLVYLTIVAAFALSGIGIARGASRGGGDGGVARARLPAAGRGRRGRRVDRRQHLALILSARLRDGS